MSSFENLDNFVVRDFSYQDHHFFSSCRQFILLPNSRPMEYHWDLDHPFFWFLLPGCDHPLPEWIYSYFLEVTALLFHIKRSIRLLPRQVFNPNNTIYNLPFEPLLVLVLLPFFVLMQRYHFSYMMSPTLFVIFPLLYKN